VEYPLETAYLDLVSRYDTGELGAERVPERVLQEAAV
jgi:hypothetical protein